MGSESNDHQDHGRRRLRRAGGLVESTSVLTGSSTLVTGRYVVAILGWAGTVVIARTLSPTAWGAFSFIFAMLGIISLVCDLQVGRVVLGGLIRAGDDAGPMLGSYLIMRSVLGAVSYAIAMAVAVLGGYPSSVVAGTAVAGFGLLLASWGYGLNALLDARRWWRTVAVASVLAQVVQLGVTLAVVASGRASVVLFCVPAVAFEVVALWWKLRAVRTRVTIRLRVDFRQWWLWLKEAALLALGGALGAVYFKVDSVLLSQLDTLRSVGIYGIGYKFSDLVGFVSIAVGTPILTLMVQAWPDDLPAYRRAFSQGFVLLAVAGVGLVVGFTAFAGPLVTLLYGTRYGDGIDASRALVVAQVVHFFAVLCSFSLIAAGRTRTYAAVMGCGLVVNLALNFALIPRWSYNGAAVATVLTEVVVVLILVRPVARLPGVRPLPWSVVGRALGAGAFMGAAIWGVERLAPWPIAAVAGAAAYLAALELLRVGGGIRALARGTAMADTGPGERAAPE